MLNFKDFMEKMKREFNGEVRLLINGDYYRGYGLIIKDEKYDYPEIKLEEAYSEYCKYGNLNDAYDYVKKNIEEFVNKNIDKKITYNDLLENIFLQLIPKKSNEDLLKKVPYKNVAEGIVMIYRVKYGTNISAIVNKDMLRSFNMTEADLFDEALRHAPANFKPEFTSMTKKIADLMGIDPGDLPPAPDLYIGTTERQSMGAAVIMYPGFLDTVYEMIGEDFSIIPSSIHEVIFVPDSMGLDPKEACDLIEYVNGNEELVSPKDRLSDILYRYDRKERRIRVA